MALNNKHTEVEEIAEQIHIWYLEACKSLDPENYNAKAQVPYSEMTEQQKDLDRFLARKIRQALTKAKEEARTTLTDEMVERLEEKRKPLIHDVNWAEGYNAGITKAQTIIKEVNRV